MYMPYLLHQAGLCICLTSSTRLVCVYALPPPPGWSVYMPYLLHQAGLCICLTSSTRLVCVYALPPPPGWSEYMPYLLHQAGLSICLTSSTRLVSESIRPSRSCRDAISLFSRSASIVNVCSFFCEHKQ